MPKVSPSINLFTVVIPLYNKGPYVCRAVDSVLNQKFTNFELIVVDDGSTDEGPDRVKRYNDQRIRLVRQDNAGVSAARNRGIDEANGVIVAFLDADDEWDACFLSTIEMLHEQYAEAGIFATAYRFCQDGVIWAPKFYKCAQNPKGGILPDYFEAGLGPAPVCASAAAVPKRILDEFGGFIVGLDRGEDLYLWTRIALSYPIAWSPKPAAIYHLDAENRSHLKNWGGEDVAAGMCVEDFVKKNGSPISSWKTIYEYLAKRRIESSLSLLLRGQRKKAFKLFRKTSSTVLFKKKRIILCISLIMPLALLRASIKIKAFLLKILNHN